MLKKGGEVYQFRRDADAEAYPAENTQWMWHEVSLQSRHVHSGIRGAHDIVDTFALTPQLLQRVCEGRPRNAIHTNWSDSLIASDRPS